MRTTIKKTTVDKQAGVTGRYTRHKTMASLGPRKNTHYVYTHVGKVIKTCETH